jgi:hypothetical protein
VKYSVAVPGIVSQDSIPIGGWQLPAEIGREGSPE